MRREFSKKIKRDAFVRANGACEVCGARLSVGKFAYDHIIPDGMGGEPVLENCQVACVACHKVKTATQDVPAIAKSKRIQDRQRNIRKPRTLRQWRKFNGDPVYAPRERS